METPHSAPLTPEQLSALDAGDGFARFEDPQTHIVYTVTREPAEREYDDDYIREKIAEAYAGGDKSFKPLDMDAIRAELTRRVELRNSASRR